MCDLRNVRVPQIPEPIQQNSLPCYARPKIIVFRTPNQLLQYHNEIIIFPHSWKYMMIFNRIEGTKDYAFLEFNKWNLEHALHPKVFTATIPEVHENIDAHSLLNQNCSELYANRYVLILSLFQLNDFLILL